MFVVLVYDTAAERNPVVLKTCRKYLHWTQRSVFEGELSAAQYRALLAVL
ncbi:CRISPR-associated endonuclease Cas2, partial [Frankia sp. Cj3]